MRFLALCVAAAAQFAVRKLGSLLTKTACESFNYDNSGVVCDKNTNCDTEDCRITKVEWNALMDQGVNLSLDSSDQLGRNNADDVRKYFEKLNTLVLSNNNLTGTIIVSLANLPNLKVLDLSNNKLIGPIPKKFKQLGQIEEWYVQNNELTGVLPPELSEWTTIKRFKIGTNQFSGALPSEYSSWGTSLMYIDISSNQFIDSLPDTYSAWTDLTNFRAASNLFSGTLPSAYKAWDHMTRFDVSNNQLTGVLPPEWGNGFGADMTEFDVANNAFTGHLPREYSAWMHIRKFGADGNSFNGSIPKTWTDCWSEMSNNVIQIDTQRATVALTPSDQASCNGTNEEFLINEGDTIDDTCSRLRDSGIEDRNGTATPWSGRSMLGQVGGVSKECSENDGSRAICERYYKRFILADDVEVGLCEFHFSPQDPENEALGTCKQRAQTHCISEVIQVMTEEQELGEDSCHAQILEARRSVDGLLAEIINLTAEKTTLEHSIKDADERLEAQLQRQNDTLADKRVNYTTCNTTAETRRDTDLRALWEELQELEMIARPQHTSAAWASPNRVNGSDLAQQVEQQAVQIRSDAKNQWDAMGHNAQVHAAAEYADEPSYLNFGSHLASSLIEGRAMTEADAQQTAFMQLEAEVHSKASAGAYLMSKAAMHVNEAHFLQHISMLNVTLDAGACAMMSSVLGRVEARFKLGIESTPTACNASRQALQREFTQAYLLIAGLYDNTSLQIQEEFTRCTDEVHHEYVRQMKDTIRELLTITEEVHRVEHAIAYITPRLDDLQRGNRTGTEHINTIIASCESSEHSDVYVRNVEQKILDLQKCPGANYFMISPMPPWIGVQGWWHNLTVTTKHDGGASLPWRRELIKECCSNESHYDYNAISAATGRPIVYLNDVTETERDFVPTFAPWGERFGMYNNFWAQAYVGTRNNFTGEVGYEFTARTSFYMSGLGRGIQSEGKLNEDRVVSLWDVDSTSAAVRKVSVGPSSPVILHEDQPAYAYEEIEHYSIVEGKTYRITLACADGMQDKWYDSATSLPEEHVQTQYARLGNNVYSTADGTYPLKQGQPAGASGPGPILRGGNSGIVTFFAEHGGSGYRPVLGH